MKKVYILGAGASASFQFEKGRCPTVSEFFIRASDLGLFERYRQEGMMEPLFRFVQQQFGVSKKELRRSPVNIEHVLTRLETILDEFETYGQYQLKGQTRRTKKRVTLSGLRFQITTFICHVLLEITHENLCPFHCRLARSLSKGDAVITFNYDLLMDSALEASGRWSPYSGYGLKFKAAIEGNELVTISGTSTSDVLCLKLHGSLNWLHGHSPWNTIYNYPIRYGQDVFLLRKISHLVESGPTDVAGKYEHVENGVYYDLHSLIVAPRADKPYESFPKVFNELWDKATKSVQQADELVIVGYSIPETDIRSKELIRAARSIRKQIAFTVVDKAPRPVVDKLQALLGYAPLKIYESFEEYIGSLGQQ
jgi:hypothetical protein